MSLRDTILAAAAVPEGESEVAGHKVRIRGLRTGEEETLLGDGLKDQKTVFAVCAACILDEKGEPMFTAEELPAFKSGALRQAYMDILALTYPKKEATSKKS